MGRSGRAGPVRTATGGGARVAVGGGARVAVGGGEGWGMAAGGDGGGTGVTVGDAGGGTGAAMGGEGEGSEVATGGRGDGVGVGTWDAARGDLAAAGSAVGDGAVSLTTGWGVSVGVTAAGEGKTGGSGVPLWHAVSNAPGTMQTRRSRPTAIPLRMSALRSSRMSTEPTLPAGPFQPTRRCFRASSSSSTPRPGPSGGVM